MVYFIDHSSNTTQSTKRSKLSFFSSNRVLYKFLILDLVVALGLFGAAVATINWYLLVVSIWPENHNNISTPLQMRFGLSTLCMMNQSNIESCHHLQSLVVKSHYRPLEETKNFNVLVVVFTSFALVTGGSTWFCKNSVPKKVASYFSIGCILFSGLCGAFGFREAYKHFRSGIYLALNDIITAKKWQLKSTQTGYSYKLAIAGEVLLFVALFLYIGELRLPKPVNDKNPTPNRQLSHYRIMRRLSTKSTSTGVNVVL